MEIAANTELVISLWTLVALWGFLWKLSAEVSKFQKEVEMELKSHDERIKELEELDLKEILTRIETNLDRIMKKMDEKDSIQ